MAFITSQPAPDPQPSDRVLDASSPDFPATGLRGTSTLRLHRMVTLTTPMILRELGELSAALRAEVDDRLRVLFALPTPPTP